TLDPACAADSIRSRKEILRRQLVEDYDRPAALAIGGVEESAGLQRDSEHLVVLRRDDLEADGLLPRLAGTGGKKSGDRHVHAERHGRVNRGGPHHTRSL